MATTVMGRRLVASGGGGIGSSIFRPGERYVAAVAPNKIKMVSTRN